MLVCDTLRGRILALQLFGAIFRLATRKSLRQLLPGPHTLYPLVQF